MVRHDVRLSRALRFVVNTARADGIDMSPVRLPLRMLERIPVHLAGRRHQKPRALLQRKAKRLVGADRAGLEGGDRMLGVVDR